MSPVPVPVRSGETLGAYFHWSFELWQSLEECNAYQAAERSFYED